MASGGNTVPRITEAEHIGPNDTGDNIEAKRVANYAWDGTNWQRQGLNLAPKTNYDYLDVQQTGSTIDTYVFKLGGASGTTVQTVVVTYVDSTKADINTVEWS